MTDTKLNKLEAIAIILTIFFAHSITSMPRDLLVSTNSATIINLIYVGIIAFVFTFIIYKLLKKFPNSDIVDISEFLGGKTLKTIIGMIFIFYFVFNASILLRNFCEALKIVYYPMTNLFFIILTFIIAICFSVKSKLKIISKVCLFLIPFVIFSMFFIFAANSSNFSTQNIFPILGNGIFSTFVSGLGNLGAFGGIVVLYFLPPYLKNPKDLKKISLISIGIAIIYIIMCVTVILFMFSFFLEIDETMPLYSSARYIEFGTFFQRLESILLLIWILEMACYLAVSIKFSMSIFKKITNVQTDTPFSYIFCLLTLAISLLPANYAISSFLESSVYKYLVIGIVFIIGISILTLAYLKKSKKKVGNVNDEIT